MPGLQGYSPADLARLRSAQHIRGGRTHATRDQVREYRDGAGRLVQERTDQLGSIIRRRRVGREGEAQDVEVFLPHLRVQWRPIATEER
ncbi:hypothetical protein HII36_29715 [Nonomuraea sp. NN258]|uniref:hypothetical protein n=1 Tax=Nonomuraea antri TaxID=2730852 RepID=UPI001568BC8B|nr:hypothetical protein [Nonomuraea antri]NRQ35979.1 hypothetical protein [Nonomuraea antri]